MIEVRKITPENRKDLLLKNEPFPMPGRFIPSLLNGEWSYRIEKFSTFSSMTFSDEAYDLDKIQQEGFAFAAYDNGQCIGLIVVKEKFWKYLYVHDLKVSTRERGKGVGTALMQAAKVEAVRRSAQGLYLHAQDNNLNACLFYLKEGFVIGGFDNHLYTGTSQQGKADITFYWDAEKGAADL